MSEQEIKICPVCQQENAAERTTCERCGSALESFNTTIQVPEEPLHEEPERARVARRTAAVGDAITLFILGHSQPIVINSRGRTILGRAAASGPMPTVDLSRYNAHLLGVSRHHAALVRTEQGYSLEDMGSTNGTWLNENRLFPNKPALLQNGDLFRLGQLMMVAYFSPATVPVEMTVFLRDALSDSTSSLSPFYLLNSVTPYLEAVANLQVILDDLRGREASDVGIQSIDLADNGRVKVVISGAPDALQIITNKVLPWRRQYLTETDEDVSRKRGPDHAETIEIGAESHVDSGYSAVESGPNQQTTVLNPDRLSAPAVDFQKQLASVIIQVFEPELPPDFDAHESYISRLLPLLTDLLTSTLEIEAEEVTA